LEVVPFFSVRARFPGTRINSAELLKVHSNVTAFGFAETEQITSTISPFPTPCTIGDSFKQTGTSAQYKKEEN